MDVRKEAKRRARLKREEFRARGEFRRADFREALFDVLRDLQEDALVALVDWTDDAVDKESTKSRYDEEETPILKGLEWDLDGEYKSGDGRRIAKRLARVDHARMSMSIDDANLRGVMKANIRKHEEFDKLEPYWGKGKTKEEAIKAYEAANPPEGS